MKRYLKVILFIFLINNILLSQNQDVIQLPGIGNRAIEPAYRMIESPKIVDTTISSTVVEYPLIAIQRPTKIDIIPIEPATVKTDPMLGDQYQTFLKLGIGSKLMPLGEIYFDSKRSRKFVYGAHVKHVSSFGNIAGYAPAQFDRTRTGLYGNINETKYSIKSELHYNNQGLHYYGWKLQAPLTTDSIDPRTTAQRFQDAGGSFIFKSHKKDSAVCQYNLGISFNNFSSKKPSVDSLSDWRAKENAIAFLSGLMFRRDKEIYALDLRVSYNGYGYGTVGDTSTSFADTGFIRKNTLINLKPSISTYLKNNRFRAQIGVDLTLDLSNSTTFHAYPLAELKYSMFNDIFIPYVGMRGGLKQLTYKSLTAENEFVLNNVSLRNENHIFDLYAGIKGTLSKRLSFNLGASYARIQDKAFFVSDTLFSVRNKFGLVYDTTNLMTIEGSLSFQIREKLKVDVIGKYYSYEMMNQKYAWNLPVWEATTRSSYSLNEKFFANLDLHLEGGRRAQYFEDSLVETGQAPVVISKEVSLGLITDINLGLEYRYNKRISAFLQLNNLLSQRYMRWFDYPVQPIQIMGGITARF
jgi:hypothetical protein